MLNDNAGRDGVGQQPRPAADSAGAGGGVNLRPTPASASAATWARGARFASDTTSRYTGTHRGPPLAQRVHESRLVTRPLSKITPSMSKKSLKSRTERRN